MPKIKLSLAGIKAWNLSSQVVPTGAYQCTVIGVIVETNKRGDGQNAVIEMRIDEGGPFDANNPRGDGASNGMVAKNWLALPSASRTNKQNETLLSRWKQFLQSFGLDAAQLEGELDLDTDQLVGNTCYYHIVPRVPGTDGNSKANFMTPAQYNEYRAGTLVPMPDETPDGGTGQKGATNTSVPGIGVPNAAQASLNTQALAPVAGLGASQGAQALNLGAATTPATAQAPTTPNPNALASALMGN